MKHLTAIALLSVVGLAFGLRFDLKTGDKSPYKSTNREFSVDFKNNQFAKDGKPFQIIGVAMHYYTIAPDLWENRLTTARAMGANVVSVYVPWNLHQPEEGQFYFDDIADIERFLKTADKLGLLVAFRPTPYIDSEWDAGGHPAWLFRVDPNMALRVSEPPEYMNFVKIWYDVLLPKIAPYTYQNGGPIIMTQIENEYGAWNVDKKYTLFLRDMLRQYLGDSHLLYTTDATGDYFLQGGTVDGAYPTIDFGTTGRDQVHSNCLTEAKFTPKGGPCVNSEFYPGWFDQWGGIGHRTTPAKEVVDTMESLWLYNASFTFYMGVGGTMWGYWAGAEGTNPKEFYSVTTSYDYDAPISEAGDPTPKFLAVRKAVEKHLGAPLAYPVPEAPAKANYGQVKLTKLGSFIDLLDTLSPSQTVTQHTYPINVEQLRHYYGFTVYESVAPVDGSNLTVLGVADRAHIVINGEVVMIFQRPYSVSVPWTQVDIKKGDKIQILLENHGRICYYTLTDLKGILGNVSIDNTIVTEWKHYPVNISRLTDALRDPAQRSKLMQKEQQRQLSQRRQPNKEGYFLPSFYTGSIDLPTIQDTFFNPTNWTKGQAFVNGVNIGRYWPYTGPQITLYTPAPHLQPKTELMLFELDGPGNCDDADKTTCYVELTDHMIYK